MGSKKRVTGNLAAAASLGVIVVWAWNGLVPEYQMTAEVGVSVGAVLGVVVAYGVS